MQYESLPINGWKVVGLNHQMEAWLLGANQAPSNPVLLFQSISNMQKAASFLNSQKIKLLTLFFFFFFAED